MPAAWKNWINRINRFHDRAIRGKNGAGPAGTREPGGRSRFRQLQMALAALILAALAAVFADRLFPIPLNDRPFATVVTAADSSLLRTFADADGIWRYPARLDEVSPLYLQALLGYEDRWFRYHPGVNPISMARAAWQNLRAGRVVSGGSTLTMQAARLLDPHSRSFAGKFKQILRALQLEWHWSKDDILTFYLNHAPFGGTLEGVQAAAHAYLGKSAAELSHAEAALLAVLPQAPSRLRPDRSPEAARAARDKVLERMARLRIWTGDLVAEARQEAVFAQYNIAPTMCPLLARRLRAAHPEARILRTTIDSRLQIRLEALARQYAFRLPSTESIAILVVDNRTMAAKAYVGSADFKDNARFGHVDMVCALRSPGSTLKPFLYGQALDAGLIHAQSLLTDAPRVGSPYQPGNFSQGFSGPVSATDALQQSLNVPAVQVLEAFGPQSLSDRLRHAGLRIRFPGDGKANLSMILGGVGTDLESLVCGYSALARDGLAARPRFLEQDPVNNRFLMTAGAAWIVRDMLRHPFPGQDRLHRLHHSPAYAWKTGTSYGFRDAWALAVCNAATVGVWIGRPDGTPSPGQYGAATAAPLLLQVLELLGLPADQLPRPATVSEAIICWPTGLEKTRCEEEQIPCHAEKKTWILEQQIPPTLPDPFSPLSGVRQSFLVNPRTGLRVDRACAPPDAEIRYTALWPKNLTPWLPRAFRPNTLMPPPDPACVHMPAHAGDDIRITGISQGARLASPPDRRGLPRIPLEAIGGAGRRTWFLNARPIAATEPNEAAGYQPSLPGRCELSVVDQAGNTDQVVFELLSP